MKHNTKHVNCFVIFFFIKIFKKHNRKGWVRKSDKQWIDKY